MIINIEVKSGKSDEILKGAVKQTRKHLIFFKKVFGCLLYNEWKFVSAVCMPNYVIESQKTVPCNNCKTFILCRREFYDVKPWLIDIVRSVTSNNSESSKKEYEALLVRLIGYASMKKSFQINKLFFDPLEYRKEAEKILTGEDLGITGEGGLKGDLRYELEKGNEKSVKPSICFMLTFAQLQAVHQSGANIIIRGDYGTGKTFVLKERAKLCSQRNPESKIAYLSLTSHNMHFCRSASSHEESIMNFISRKEFLEFENIEVFTNKDLNYHLKENMTNTNKASISEVLMDFFLENNDYEYIFIDELEVRGLSDFFLSNKS